MSDTAQEKQYRGEKKKCDKVDGKKYNRDGSCASKGKKRSPDEKKKRAMLGR